MKMLTGKMARKVLASAFAAAGGSAGVVALFVIWLSGHNVEMPQNIQVSLMSVIDWAAPLVAALLVGVFTGAIGYLIPPGEDDQIVKK